MEFKDRLDAAKKLYELLEEEENDVSIIVSLLRGGAIMGDYLANKLKVKHYPLVSVKVSAPFNSELAIGAICFDVTHMNTKIINMLNLSNNQIAKQVKEAEKKFINYCTKYNIEEKQFDILQRKTIVITDDGVATGSTLLAAVDFIKIKDPQKITLALPVAPKDFEIESVDKSLIIIRDPSLSAISQYYKNFPQIEDKEIKELKSLTENIKF
ncbi:MAG: phosphoribosyltransferase family protein [bacterium]